MILKCFYLDAPDPAFLTLDARYQAGFIDIDALRKYASQPEYDLPERFLAGQRETDDECFAIRDGDTLAAYGWYSSRAHQFADDLTLRFGPEWVYVHRVFTHPAYRGQRLHAIGKTMVLAAYRARGFKGLVSCVDARNAASLKSCYRMGCRPFGTIYFLRLGRLLGLRPARGSLLEHPLVYCTPGCRMRGFWLERDAASGLSPGALQPLRV